MGTRAFTRVNASTKATICLGNQTVHGIATNVSLQGLYVRIQRHIPLHHPIRVMLVPQQSEQIQADAEVVWLDQSGGMGIQINRIDVNSFVNLRNFIARQQVDFNDIMMETYKMIDCIN